MKLPVRYRDITAAAKRLDGVANRTPVATSTTLDERTGVSCFLKCENFQRAGAFKFRGAYNALSRHRKAHPGIGAITASSGNHGQALALAGRLLEVPVTIVMPSDAPRIKLDATRGYGGEIVLYDRDSERREDLAERLAAERGLLMVPPFDHPDVIAGQGTATRELIEETGKLDWLLVPCGGGGLLSGAAIAAHKLTRRCRVVGVEPAAGDDAARSFRSGQIERVDNPQTIADGARTDSLGEITFAIISTRVSDVVTVSDEAILDAMLFLWQRMKLVVEPTGALAVAALLSGAVKPEPGARVGIIVSGGNVDLERVCKLIGDR